MKAKLLPLLIANLVGVSTAALAQEPGLKITGSVGVSGIAISEDSRDASKLNEYGDLSPGGAGVFDIQGRGSRHFFDGFGENIGRDDMYLDFRGGAYGQFKYRLYSDWLRHNQGFGPDGGRTPYVNPGESQLRFFSPLPAARLNSNVPPWTAFDTRTFRKDTGGNVEFSGGSPWYVRFDANEVRQTGINNDAAALGTSPGNGFIDLPNPVDYTTRNFIAEAGYQAPRGHLSVNYTYSRFQNENVLLSFQNGFFGNGFDTFTSAPDNDYMRIAASGALRQLPLSSTLSGRLAYSKVENSADMLGAVLNTAGSAALVATNPSTLNYDGKVENTTAQFGLSSLPMRNLDTRLYYNYYKRENDSTQVTFQTTTAGLSCFAPGTTGPGNVNVFCTGERYGYTKHNPGFELGYRLNAENRLSGGYDYLSTDREDRPDVDKTRDNRFFIQWANTSFETVSTRLKYQYLNRSSDFLTDDAGFNANSPFYLERFNRAYDVADVDQHLIKAVVDWTPMPFLDFGLEAYFKKNDYKDLTLGRTKDERKEFYASVSYGDPSVFRVTLFGDIEFIEYDSYHRTVSTVAGNGACTAAAPNCFDPNTAPTAQNFNWGSTLEDTNWMVGVGADWPLMPRLVLKAAAIYAKTDGSVDFSPQTLASGAPAANLPPINAYDNTRRTSLSLRAVWQADKNWELSGGYAYERYTYEDAQYENYQYTVGTGTSTSFLSGIYAFQDYKANILFGTVRYKF